MKINLTESQAWATLRALEWAKNDQFGESDPINRSYTRIQNKIVKELKEYCVKQGIDLTDDIRLA